ncbi:MAG: hypothetical protein HY331_03170 [Chloroflexi bacterium]|nr:hypothetical protein [Chloroflexota bacterium]
MTPELYLLGVDLGQAQDFTALAIAETAQADPPRTYLVRHLQRWPLGTTYPAIVEDLRAMLGQSPLAGRSVLVVDGTGVGRAVVDLLRSARLGAPLLPITITGGNVVTTDGAQRNVPKRDLVGVLQVLLHTRRLLIGQDLPEARTLVGELLGFQVKITDAGRDTYGAWREGAHDDLVLALAVACWLGEQPVPRFQKIDVGLGSAPAGNGHSLGARSPVAERVRLLDRARREALRRREAEQER